MDVIPGIENMLQRSLGVSPDDFVLVAHDEEKADVADAVFEYLRGHEIPFTKMPVSYDGQQIPPLLASLLLDDIHYAVVLLFGKSIWHQPERRAAKYDKGKRLVSFHGTLDMLSEGPALADPKKLRQICKDLMEHVADSTSIVIEGPFGTRISARCEKIGYEDGCYTRPKQGGNFPCGEIYAYGLDDDSIEGFVRSNIKVKHLGLTWPGNDAIFNVQAGRLSPTDPEAERFFHLLKGHEELWHVAELAFGINPYTKRFDCPSSAQEEKILGTAHVGLGSSISFGGNRTGRHMDAILGPATVKIDDMVIIYNGKMNGNYLSPASRQWVGEHGLLCFPKKG